MKERYWFIRFRLMTIIFIGRLCFDLGSLLLGASVSLLLLTILSVSDAITIGFIVHAIHLVFAVFVGKGSYWELLFTRESGLRIMRCCLKLHEQDPAAAFKQFVTYLESDNQEVADWLRAEFPADTAFNLELLVTVLQRLSLRSLLISPDDAVSPEMEQRYLELAPDWLHKLH